MSFKVGDHVWLKNVDATIPVNEFIIIATHFNGLICDLQQIKDPNVAYSHSKYGGHLYVLNLITFTPGLLVGKEYYLELTTAVAAAQQSIADALGDAMIAALERDFGIKEPSCDCGGFSAYQSMADHYHSDWCKSRGK